MATQRTRAGVEVPFYMVRVSSRYRYKTARGMIGMVCAHSDEVSTVLLEFSKKEGSQWFLFIEDWLLQPCNAPMIEIWSSPGSYGKTEISLPPMLADFTVEMGAHPGARPEDAPFEQNIRTRKRPTRPCAADDAETWILSLDATQMRESLRVRLGLCDKRLTDIEAEMKAEITRLELIRLGRLETLKKSVGLEKWDNQRLTLLRKKHRNCV